MCGVGASDLSTSLGCPTMIKDLYAHRQKVQGEKGNMPVDRGSQGAEAPRKYFR